MADTPQKSKDVVVAYVKLADVEKLLSQFLAPGPIKEVLKYLGDNARFLPAAETTMYSALVFQLLGIITKQLGAMTQVLDSLVMYLETPRSSTVIPVDTQSHILQGLMLLMKSIGPQDELLSGVAFLLDQSTIAARVLKSARDLEDLDAEVRRLVEGLLEDMAEKVAEELKLIMEAEAEPVIRFTAGEFDALVDEIVRALAASGVLVSSYEHPLLAGIDLDHFTKMALRRAFTGFIEIS